MKLTQILCLFLLMGFLSLSTFAQELENIDMGELHCGDIIENEFRANYESHIYTINLNAGDVLNILGVPLGDKLAFRFWMQDREANPIAWTDGDGNPEDTLYSKTEKRPNLNSGVLSSSGNYIIAIPNSNWGGNNPNESTGLGLYTLFVKCIKRDGTVIEAGDKTQPEPDPSQSSTQPTPEFSGFGFPGLPPVNFTNGVTIPLTLEIPNAGSISSGFEGIFGYSFSAQAGQTMTLDFARTAGNLNLGVVLLSADNQVAFQASLVTSNTLATELTIPAGGDYTLGVFRIELIPPDVPENTNFALTATLN